MIYFGDAEIVEKHLHEDLNTIIKNVKVRQEQHLELLEYNKAIANKKRSIENTIFINDEITTHNKFLREVLEAHSSLLRQQDEIVEKYDQASVKFESVMKLMARVVTRIIQTNQSFIDKIKSYDQNFIQQFGKMKGLLTKLINSKDQIDLGLSTKTIIQYSKNRASHQIQKLKLLIKTLEDGQIQKVPFIYKGVKPNNEPPKIQVKQVKVEKPMEKKKSPPPKKDEKHEAVAKIRHEIKMQENAKKQRKNLANRLATMYSTMDLSKKQFVEDIMAGERDFERIYGEILMRNKFNQEQILQFQAKKDEFDQKVKSFKEMMLQESKKIQEVLMIKKPVKVEKRADTQSDSASKLQPQDEEENKNPESTEESPTRQFKRAFVLRQKAASPKFHKQAEYTQMRITQEGFNHIKFDTSNQEIFLRSNRNRLPSIQQNVKSGSVDNRGENSNKGQNQNREKVQRLQGRVNDNKDRYHITKPREDKQQARKNFLMKNIELGVQNVIKNNQLKTQSESKNIAEKLKELQPAGSINSVNLMEFTFYGSKKKSFVLGDNRNNFVF